MDESRIIAAAGDPSPEAFTLLVGVGDPEHVEQLMRTAADIARAENGSIHVVSVVVKDYDSPFGIFDDETIREEFAGERRPILEAALEAGARHEVPVTGAVVVERSVSRGLVRTATAVDAGGVLLGWTGPPWRPRAVLGTTVDAMFERATVDVYVERIGATANGVDGVLVPVAGGPHQGIAARAGEALAVANEATLTLFSVIEPTASTTGEPGDAPATPAANEHVESALEVLDRPQSQLVETRIRESDDVVDAILDAAEAHDVVVMGATRGGPLRARLVGSIPRAVTDGTNRTVLLARHSTGGSKSTNVLGRLRRR